jgi:protocatechuate 3,4-dioxygenase alpha subunit
VARETPFQTVGPFFDFGLDYIGSERLIEPQTQGRRIMIGGVVLDGVGAPISDALVEIWQANAAGRYHHPDDDRDAPLDPAFDGFGRSATDALGRFRFETVMPGRVPGPGGAEQSPHVVVSLLGRGLLTRLVTRIYFEDDPTLSNDPVLRLVPESRRRTLIARRDDESSYRFDIVVQGAGETVFFDV